MALRRMRECKFRSCINLTRNECGYCDEHIKYADIERKKQNKRYNDYSRNKDTSKIYDSKHWKNKRQYIQLCYNNLDIYQYYINKRIVEASLVHHIVELREDISKAYDNNNLIPLSEDTHTFVHNKYNSGKREKESMQKLLQSLLERWNRGERV